MRKDLLVRRGKAEGQVAHASLQVFLQYINLIAVNNDNSIDIQISIPDHGRSIKEWINEAQTKIVVYVNSEEELVNCYNQAKAAGLPCSLITDSGKTEFHNVPTKTTCGIGPADAKLIDEITGKLGLI